MRYLNIWVIQRNGLVSSSVKTTSYEINRDYITSEKSTFEVSEALDFAQGDFLMAKFPHGEGLAFLGLIDSYENKTIVCEDLFSIVDFEFPATRMSGKSFEQHAKNLINRYLLQDANKIIDILDVETRTSTNHIYQPSEPPTPTNLQKYLINAFKKYNVVWRIDRYENFRIKSVVERVSSTLNLKNNNNVFIDWDISTVEVGRGIENHLQIINKNTTNSEGPNILSEWWLTTNNEVTQNANHPDIFRPTKTKIWIYDTTEEEKPSYQDIAESELKGSYYAHEITFKMPIENELIKFEDLNIGRLANIIYDDKQYQSVLTGYLLTNDSDSIELRFGHIRSRLSELLE